MTASVDFLTLIVSLAVFVTALTPIVLLVIWIKDWRGGQLW